MAQHRIEIDVPDGGCAAADGSWWEPTGEAWLCSGETPRDYAGSAYKESQDKRLLGCTLVLRRVEPPETDWQWMATELGMIAKLPAGDPAMLPDIKAAASFAREQAKKLPRETLETPWQEVLRLAELPHGECAHRLETIAAIARKQAAEPQSDARTMELVEAVCDVWAAPSDGPLFVAIEALYRHVRGEAQR